MLDRLLCWYGVRFNDWRPIAWALHRNRKGKPYYEPTFPHEGERDERPTP